MVNRNTKDNFVKTRRSVRIVNVEHVATWKGCPEYKKEYKIKEVMTINKVTTKRNKLLDQL